MYTSVVKAGFTQSKAYSQQYEGGECRQQVIQNRNKATKLRQHKLRTSGQLCILGLMTNVKQLGRQVIGSSGSWRTGEEWPDTLNKRRGEQSTGLSHTVY